MTKEQIHDQIKAVSTAYYKLPSTPKLMTIGWNTNEALKFSLESNKIATKIQNAIFETIFGNFDKAALIIDEAAEKVFTLFNEIIRH